MSNLTVRYTFEPYFDGYFQDGDFFGINGRLLEQKYYSGRTCINYKGKRFGIKKLRFFSKKTEIEKEILPF